ncbi:condensin complex subunit 3 [Trypanosoma conorhini]|uniref:Condensin complex subunit 3 n=1 Tax=Trypanosoma conorhini TaxID=83891 RepID=A0A422PXM1_9TRYP|nr:condensin complex subunit 3 [Trypanosoma conorhini]RNF22458.1 condensin complex subunit 3 [Trypanosoma conorhini]
MPPKKVAGACCGVEDVGRVFQQIHKSAAHFHKCRTNLLNYAEENRTGVIDAVCRVVLLVLKESPRLAPDSLRRHHSFLTEVCKGFRERFHSDEIAIALLKAVEPFHNANDKTVRLGVVSVFDALLKTVDQSDTSEERQNFYQNVAEMLKLRAHDKFPAVRERAVSAVSCFQSGKKDCDVTQQLMALLCTDNSADVRRQILRCICARKEFLEGYFHGMIRSVRDVVSRVRAEAWDALSRFHWKYLVAYATAKNIPLPDLIHQGLSDASSSVAIACRAALTNCWLHRDYRDDGEAMLELVLAGGGGLEPYEAISTEVLLYCRKHRNARTSVVNFESVSAASLLLWKANAKLAADTEGDDETAVLLPLSQFSTLLQETVYAYARPDVDPKAVKFKNVDEADIILRILLSAFDVYEENGYLAHADNTTRGSLLRIIGFLLKVVPDDDPALFIDVAVRSLKSLTGRTPEEATKTITASLDSLFRSLKLPQMYALGYDDVEAFGRKSRERQRELFRLRMKLRGGETSQEAYDQLKEEMDRDEKFLLRMQFIVLAFLSHSQRGDTIPTFCSHIIQLGRQQDNEAVKVASTTSLGLQCLVNPDTVHTFMPLILSDANEIVGSSDRCVALAALGVVFDLVMEYGLRFFDCPARDAGHGGHYTHAGAAELGTGTTTTKTAGTNAAVTSSSTGAAGPIAADAEARLHHERALAQEDEHRVGGNNLLNTLRSFLRSHCAERNPMVVVGFCKLLSCNRVPHAQVPEIIAEILMHYMAYRQEEKGNASAAYMVDFLNKFLYSFASSHPNRQMAFAQGGVVAFTALLRYNPTVALRLMELATRLSDAYVLVQIREIDPATARQVARLAEGENTSMEDSTLNKNASARSTATRTSTRCSRLMRELSRFSLHEYIASELLIEISQTDSGEVSDACLDTLEKRMYFYAKEAPSWLLFCANRALTAANSNLQSRLQKWIDDVCARFPPCAESDVAASEANVTKWQETLEARERAVEKLLDSDIANVLCQTIRCVPPGEGPEVALSAVKMERKRERETDTTFGINSMLTRQRRTRR